MEGLPRYRTGDDELDEALLDIATRVSADPNNTTLVFELLASAARLGKEQVDRGDLKLINNALKEMRYAELVFAPYRDVRKLSIFGSARTKSDNPDYLAARSIAEQIVEKGWMVMTGAGPGVMEAGIQGATAANSFGIGIQLPFEPTPPALIADDPKYINFRYFFTRKLSFIKESHGFALLPGGFGTMDEAFELLTLLQTGKTYPAPVVLLDSPGNDYWPSWLHFVREQLLGDGLISEPDLGLISITDSVDKAVEELTHFYHRYHSMRFVGRRLVIRLNSALESSQIRTLAEEFGDIIAEGTIEAIEATSAEVDDHDVVELPRIAFTFNRHGYARLRAMVNTINDF